MVGARILERHHALVVGTRERRPVGAIVDAKALAGVGREVGDVARALETIPARLRRNTETPASTTEIR